MPTDTLTVAPPVARQAIHVCASVTLTVAPPVARQAIHVSCDKKLPFDFFWLSLLCLKFWFSYCFQIEPLIQPTLDLWEVPLHMPLHMPLHTCRCTFAVTHLPLHICRYTHAVTHLPLDTCR